ncbi:hypothetical protein Taro_027509, partial [Colocasia esculenta]|nr:hypothetical protein [Colocasia esculenta]
MSAACRRLGARVDVSGLKATCRSVAFRARFDEFPSRGHYMERREPRTGFVLHVLREVERQLDPSSMAARLRGSPVLFVR